MINGGRPGWTQITQDGINIQDNILRTNAVDFAVNRPTSDGIGEFTITTSNQGADAAGGASQVRLITPSGTNRFSGSIYEFNRNSAVAANNWFNNASNVGTPFLNRNQFGGRLGGPIIKNKLFFFGYYEGLRQVTTAVKNNVIPVRDDFLTGVFRYVRPSDGAVQTVNLLQLSGLQLDPKVKSQTLDLVPSASRANNFDIGDSTPTRFLNTAGFRFNQRRVTNRDNFGFRSDYELNSAHRFEFTFTRNTNFDDVPASDDVNPRPVVFTKAQAHLLVGAWRWTISPRLHNELRIGANLSPIDNDTTEDTGGLVFNVPLITNRATNNFQPNGRISNTRQFIDNASLVLGNHALRFGGSWQQVRANLYFFQGRDPNITFGFSASAPAGIQLTAANFPGSLISATNLASANAWLAFLGGIVTTVSQTLQVRDKTSGFIPGIRNNRNFLFDDLAFYFQDNWRVRPNLTLTAGLKWEYFSPVRERDDLSLQPALNGRSIRDVLLDPNGSVDFVSGDFYRKDLNNFAPVFGLAWDPFKNGRMAVRGGYTLAYINEDGITVARNAATLNNAGLSTAVTLTNQFFRISQGLPPLAATFKMPRTYADQLAVSPVAIAFGIDPNIRQPYVHQLSLGIQRELPFDFAVEARYVGTLGRRIWRGIDLNQIKLSDAFLQDFLRARGNGFLALARPANSPGCTAATCGVFNPAYSANIPGSQQLTVIPTFGGGSLANATARTRIQTGQAAALADFYLTQRVAGASAAFLPNPGIYSSSLLYNGAETDYHALQAEVRRRFRHGIFGQLNYTFSKLLADSSGTTSQRFEPFLDNARPQLERTRAEYHLTHVVNANFVAELPFGKDRRFFNRRGFPNRVIGGWEASSIIHWQSGAPFSILSVQGTFNRAGRSGAQTADSTLTLDRIRDLFGISKLPDGRVFYLDPKVTDPQTGRAVGPDTLDNAAGFTGQVFFNPTAGNVGALPLLQFDGPSQFAWDCSLIKRTQLSERMHMEFRAEFFNVLNHPNFVIGDTDVNSANFGKITATNPNYGARVIQFALKLNF